VRVDLDLRTLLLVGLFACGAADDRAPTTQPPTPAPVAPAAKPATWSLTLASDYGPCSEDDPRPCHIRWTATPDGKIVKDASPNDPKKPDEVTTITLSGAERDELAAIVTSTAFTDGMAKGFACQGGGSDPDANLSLHFGGERQYIERCVRGSDGDNVPRKLESLLRR